MPGQDGSECPVTEIADFLRARYAEARDRQQRIVRSTWELGALCPVCSRPTSGLKSSLGGRSFGWPLGSFEPCGHEIHESSVMAQFEEPAPDPDVIADLDAKLQILDEVVPEIDAMEDRIDAEWGAGDPTQRESMTLLRILARPFAEHPSYRKEDWAS